PNGTPLAVGGTDAYRSDTPSFVIPERYRNNVFFLVVADAGHDVAEWPNEDNNVFAFRTFAQPLPLPDLVVGEVAAPDQATVGADVTFTHAATTRGSGAPSAKDCSERVWLAIDRARPPPGLGDVLLGTFEAHGDEVLARTAGYDVTRRVRTPAGIDPGNYFLT